MSAGCVFAGVPSDDLLKALVRQGQVSDYAEVFPASLRTALENDLLRLRGTNGADIAVVTLASLEGGQIDDFGNKLFNRWGIGAKGRNDGILLIAAIKDRKVRIEVGYGLEGVVPDARAGRILDEYVLPFFKQTKYAEGLANGARALASAVAPSLGIGASAPPAAAPATQHASATNDNPWPFLVFFAIIFLILILSIAARRGGRRGSHGAKSGGDWSGSGGGDWSGGGSSSGSSGSDSGGSSGGGGASRGW